MKMTKDQARKSIFDAMLFHDGNRVKAAETLNVSLRTFYRHLDEYEMHPLLERCGWIQHKGPQRGRKAGEEMIRGMILKHIAAGKGLIDMGRLTTDVYAEDRADLRTRLMATIGRMRTEGILDFDGIDKWTIRRKPKK